MYLSKMDWGGEKNQSEDYSNDVDSVKNLFSICLELHKVVLNNERIYMLYTEVQD